MMKFYTTTHTTIMQNLKELFDLIGKRKFIENYTTINPTGGIQSRISGKGTNEKDKKTEPSEAETAEIKAGLQEMVKDMNQVIEKL